MVMGLAVGLGVDGMQPMVLYLDNLKCLEVGGCGKLGVRSVRVWRRVGMGVRYVLRRTGVAVTNRE